MSISRADLPRFLALGSLALLVMLALLFLPSWGDDGVSVTADDISSDIDGQTNSDIGSDVVNASAVATATPLATVTPLPSPTALPSTPSAVPATATPTAPATATPVPVTTATTIPATATPEPATATTIPVTATPEPATATAVPATATAVPATATPDVATVTPVPSLTPDAAIATATPAANALGVVVFAGQTYAVGAQNLYVRADGGLNVRPGPGDKSRVVAVLEDGASIAITGRAVNDVDGVQWFELAQPVTLASAWVDAGFVGTEPTLTPSPTPDPASPTVAPTTASPVGDPTADQWLAVRLCESGNDYTIDTGNGFFGAYQFKLTTWENIATQFHPHLVGVLPNMAPPADQDAMALSLYQTSGRGQWPRCGLNLP